MQEVAKLTRLVNGRPRVIADPPLIVPIADLLPKQMDQETFARRNSRTCSASTGGRWKPTGGSCSSHTQLLADMARKVVGVGSLEVRWIFPGQPGTWRARPEGLVDASPSRFHLGETTRRVMPPRACLQVSITW